MGCQKTLLKKLSHSKLITFFESKDNHPYRYHAIQNYFVEAFDANFEGDEIDFAETFDKGHGRLESRVLGWL